MSPYDAVLLPSVAARPLSSRALSTCSNGFGRRSQADGYKAAVDGVYRTTVC
jgi:hypothetical protein